MHVVGSKFIRTESLSFLSLNFFSFSFLTDFRGGGWEINTLHPLLFVKLSLERTTTLGHPSGYRPRDVLQVLVRSRLRLTTIRDATYKIQCVVITDCKLYTLESNHTGI